MEYTKKACLAGGRKTGNMMVICMIATIALLGLALGIFAFFAGNIVFGVLYCIAFFFGLSYAVIRINTIVPSFLATAGRQLVIQNWENGLFPFNIDFRPKFFCDFIPAKTKVDYIDIPKITKLMIGTKGYLIRNLTNTRFATDIAAITAANPRCEKLLQKLDLLYVETIDQEVYYMSIDHFDAGDLAEILTEILHYVPQLQIRCSNANIRRRLPK